MFKARTTLILSALPLLLASTAQAALPKSAARPALRAGNESRELLDDDLTAGMTDAEVEFLENREYLQNPPRGVDEFDSNEPRFSTIDTASKPLPPIYIRVSVGKQYDALNCRVSVRVGGKVVKSGWPCTAAKKQKSQFGNYTVSTRRGKFTQISLGSKSPGIMQNAVYFDGKIALHRGALSHGSHGCIHLSSANSSWLYDLVTNRFMAAKKSKRRPNIMVEVIEDRG